MSVPIARPECSLCERQVSLNAQSSKLHCNHIYHKGCLDNWLVKFNCCPYDGNLITSINDEPYPVRNRKRAILSPRRSDSQGAKRTLFTLTDSPLRDVRPILNPRQDSPDSYERLAAKLRAVLQAKEEELLCDEGSEESSSGDETDENMPPLVDVPLT